MKGLKRINVCIISWVVLVLLLSGSHVQAETGRITAAAALDIGLSDLEFLSLPRTVFAPAQQQALQSLTERQRGVLFALHFFDRNYVRRACQGMRAPDFWKFLGADIFNKYNYESLHSASEDDAPYVMRALLARGQCYLFAATDYMERNDRQAALEMLHIGLPMLDSVIKFAADNPDADLLPSWSTMYIEDGGNGLLIHPLTGYESIGTLVRGMLFGPATGSGQWSPPYRLGQIHRQYHTVSSGIYVMSLPEYQSTIQDWLTTASEEQLSSLDFFRQRSTSKAAAYFLSEFCPWGVELYMLLYDAGLTHSLDYRILRPFSNNGFKEISEFNIDAALVPEHVRADLEQIIGDRKSGLLGPGRTRPIDWEWVGEKPTWTIKFVSPMVYERFTITERFRFAMLLPRLAFGGPVNYVVDATLDTLLGLVGGYYGDDSPIYGASWALVYGHDKGIITTDFVTRRQLPSPIALLDQLATAAFEALERKMIEDLYEGIDPRQVSIGTSYNGTLIPPVMIRGDVLGFQRLPRHEYLRTIQAVRHYILNPAAVMRRAPHFYYDLGLTENYDSIRRSQYLSEQTDTMNAGEETVRRVAWPRCPTPFGIRDYITDFSPRSQILIVQLPESDFASWEKKLPENTLLHIQLLADGENYASDILINERIHTGAVTLTVFNTHNSGGKSDYIDSDSSYRAFMHGRRLTTRPMHPATYRYFAACDERPLPVETLALETENRLQKKYRLRVTLGKKGPILAEYPVVFAPERGPQSKDVTGELTQTRDGSVILEQVLEEMSPPPVSSIYIGFMDSEWFEDHAWKQIKKHTQAIGKTAMFESQGLRMTFDGDGNCAINDIRFVIHMATPVEAEPEHADLIAYLDRTYAQFGLTHYLFKETLASGDIRFTVTKSTGNRVAGFYEMKFNARTWLRTIDYSIRALKEDYLENAKGTGTWEAVKVSNDDSLRQTWRVDLKPGDSAVPEIAIPLRFIIHEEFAL